MEAAWLDELEGECNRLALLFCPNNTFTSCETEKLYEFIGFLRHETCDILKNQRTKKKQRRFKQKVVRLDIPFRGVGRPCAMLL